MQEKSIPSQLLRAAVKNFWFRIIVLVVTISALIAFGVLGSGVKDSKFIYVAGLTWLQGSNAYDPLLASQASDGLISPNRYNFAYPPQISPLALLMGVFPWDKAHAVITLINFIFLGWLIYFCCQFVRRGTVKSLNDVSETPLWLIPALIICSPFTMRVISMGQTTLVVAASLSGSWYFYNRKRWLPSGILLAVATIKPQISLLVIIWFLLERQWKILSTAAVAALGLSLIPMLITGPIDVFVEWISAVRGYKSGIHNSLGYYDVFGLQNLLYTLGIKLPVLLPIATLLTGLMWWMKSRLIQDDIFAIILCISFLFGFSHNYDLVALAPLIPAFWRHLQNQGTKDLIPLGLLAGMLFPRRFLIPLNIEILLHLRVLILLVAAVWLLLISIRQASYLNQLEITQESSTI